MFGKAAPCRDRGAASGLIGSVSGKPEAFRTSGGRAASVSCSALHQSKLPRMPPKRQSRKWIVRPHDERAAGFATTLGVSPIVAGLLLARGYDDAAAAEDFLKPSLDQLHDPHLMRGMSDAVGRLLH